MKKLVLTLTVGDAFQKMASVSHPTLEAYAARCGADFKIWRDHDPTLKHPGFMKFDMGEFLGEYQRILYVDTDLLIRDDAPDLFESVPYGSFAAFNEGLFMDRGQAKVQFLTELDDPTPAQQKTFWVNDPTYFNTGVMLFDDRMAPMFELPKQQVINFYEQTQFNWELYKFLSGIKTPGTVPDIQIHELNYKLNRMSHMDKVTGESRLDSYFLHYAGAMGQDGTRSGVVQTMTEDLERWNKEPRVYRKKIYVVTGGGIGDVVATEPVVRYISETCYPEDEVVLKTNLPELFTHIAGIKILPKDLTVHDTGFYEMNLMPTPDKPVNNYVTHMLTHPLTYGSIMALKAELPSINRTIKLPDVSSVFKPELESVLKRSIAIHPGKGWPSKTFPTEWWQEVIVKIMAHGYDVALIGKRGAYNSVVDLGLADSLRLHDYTDKFSLLQTCRAIELCPVLISNDSSPIHIAGAFDNWIGLLATVKHPDRILPFRNGFQRHKASVLSRRIVEREFRPNCPIEVRVDSASEEEVLACLPKPSEVVQWLQKLPLDLND